MVDVASVPVAEREEREVVVTLSNNVAYLKRQVGRTVSELAVHSHAAPAAAIVPNGNGSTAGRGYEVKAKYRDPKTNETWSGRGRMASWLKSKQDAGEDIDDYLV